MYDGRDYITLNPIRGNDSDWDEIEAYLKQAFKKEIYLPLIKSLGENGKTLKNARSGLYEALSSGRVTFSRGTFSGKFNATISKELKSFGAKWDAGESAFKLTISEMPLDLRNMVSATEFRFQEKISKIDRKLAQILPEEIAGRIKLSDKFDSTIWKVDKNFRKTVEGITVAPQLTSERRKKIAEDWQENMRLYIKDFTEGEIKKLRKDLKTSVFAGNRYESAISTIQKSYEVSKSKAKFLARQESKLLITTFQETRYSDAGIYEYTWHSVAGSPAHPVRPRHKFLADQSKKGKIYRWDDPPVTTELGEPERRNNPGRDYNCRCFAKPVVRFKKDVK